MQQLILADDFTGASDAAAPFASTRSTLVVLASDWESGSADVLAVDLDLRECSDQHAQHVTEAAARRLCSRFNPERVFVKIDSTLRGPIAGLASAALIGSGKGIAVIAPAFPEQGRFLHEGNLVVDGLFGPSLIETLGMEGTALVGARFVRSAEDVERAVEHARTRGARRVVVDADSSDCLRHVANAWRHHPDWLLVGSSGLARQVAGAATAVEPGKIVGPVLVVAGSPAPMTVAQIDRLRGIGSMTMVEANAPVPPLPPVGHLLLVCTPEASERDTGDMASAVARTVGEWSSRGLRPVAVVLAGGATARKVCERLGAVGVGLSGELSPGVPIGRLVGGVWSDVPVVTKAGGFGTPTTLLDVVRALGVVSIDHD